MEHGCMVYTERAETATVSPGISHVTHKQRRKYTTSVDIHSESHATWTLWVCSRAENSAIQKGTTTTVAGQSGHIFCVVTGQFCCVVTGQSGHIFCVATGQFCCVVTGQSGHIFCVVTGQFCCVVTGQSGQIFYVVTGQFCCVVTGQSGWICSVLTG